MSSLRNKIILSTSVSKVTLLAMAVLMYADLNYLQNQIIESVKVTDFIASTQELQHDEENFLLYHDINAYFQLHQQLDSTRKIYADSRPMFIELIDSDVLNDLDQSLLQYDTLLEDMIDLQDEDIDDLQIHLKKTSESISQDVHELGQRHHQILSEVTSIVSWTLAITMSLAVVIGVASAVFVIRQIIRPINDLENQLDAVADGKEKKLNLDSDDIEMKSFVQHFNTMLDRLRSQQSQLRHHEKAAALGVLVSGVAHELNNPLSNISTSVQLLMEDDDTDRELGKQWLTHVDNETERARRIVKRLLDSVRHPVLNMQNIHADELVRSAVLLIHRQLDPDILLHIEDVPDICVHVDRERMQQVFINLIRNAVDAGAKNIWIFADKTTWAESSPEDIERVQGEVSYISDADELLLFTVADDGPGIPEENLSQLFTPFFTTKSGGEGTGLGLYLVEEIIDEHDGCITVENQKDCGTQFLIWLPITCEECKE